MIRKTNILAVRAVCSGCSGGLGVIWGLLGVVCVRSSSHNAPLLILPDVICLSSVSVLIRASVLISATTDPTRVLLAQG